MLDLVLTFACLIGTFASIMRGYRSNRSRTDLAADERPDTTSERVQGQPFPSRSVRQQHPVISREICRELIHPHYLVNRATY